MAGECEGYAGALAQLPAGVQGGLAMLVHDGPKTDGLLQEFRSPKVILLAKSEIRTIYVQHELEGRVCRRINSCETDFASSIKSADDPNGIKLVESLFPLDS